ncbi:MAG: efflux RND transporter permease subunit, partial [Cyanobacteria bacterium J06635_13]
RIGNAQRADLSQIASLDLSSQRSESNDFRSTSALGEFNLRPQLSKISRRSEQRVNTVQGFITAGVLPSEVLADFQSRLEATDFQLPPGYRYEWGGELEESSEAQGNLALYVPILLVVMVTALVLSLGSFRQTGIVVAVAVGCIGMALFSLKISGSPLGFMAIVGTMGLVGIAINNGIIVLSAFNENPEAREGKAQAIEDVVVQATRHIVTTTITTIAGFVPLLVSGGPFWRPLAIAIAGGINGSLLLALYFVPAIYLVMKRRDQKKSGKKPQRFAPEEHIYQEA